MPHSTPSFSTRLSSTDFDELITLLEIRVLGLSECLVSEGFVLELDGNDAPGIHYILSGVGLLHIDGAASVKLLPHTLLIVPSRHPLRLEVPTQSARNPPTVISGREHKHVVDSIKRFRAGSTEPMTVRSAAISTQPSARQSISLKTCLRLLSSNSTHRIVWTLTCVPRSTS
jgi:AraC family transcriptional regulator, activator of mtrCDE